MKLNFDENTKKEVTERFTDDMSEMAVAIDTFFGDMHDWAAEEGYHQYNAAYEKFRSIYTDEMASGAMKLFEAWKQSDASITALLKEMKAVPEDRIKALANEFEAPLEEALRDAVKCEITPLTADDTVHLTRSLEEDNEVLQEMLDTCFDDLDDLLFSRQNVYEYLSEDNQLYVCVGALFKSILTLAASLYDSFAKAAEELGIHLADRAGKTAAKATDSAASLQHSSEEFVNRLDKLIELIED